MNQRLQQNILSIILTLILSLAVSVTAHSETFLGEGESFKVSAQGKPLGELLRELAARNGVAIRVDSKVKGSVNGNFDLQPQALLELLASNFGFVWYFDGTLLDVTSAEDIRSQITSLENISVSNARRVLQKLRIADERYPVEFDSRSRTAKVSGPSRYVSLVIEAIQSAEQDFTAPASTGQETAVRLVPLTYAWAKDITYVVGGRAQVLPGVASIMSSLYQNGVASPSVVVDDFAISRNGARVGNQTLDQLGALGLVNSETRPQPSRSSTGAQIASINNPSAPRFVAEGRMNAVLVRDAPERLDAHERTIRSLDVKPGLVEIEARIIEVNSDSVESLGIDWRFQNRTIDAQIGAQPIPSLGFEVSGSELQPNFGPGGVQQITPSPTAVLTTVLGDAGRNLITRVNALADQGKANLLSSPKVLTLDNVEATMEDVETFFIRVAGNLEVDLFDVSVGTTLRVTPLIVEEGWRDTVKMAITIEDGRLNGLRVDDIPTVQRSRIRTQSIVGNGEALLIAGYTRESKSTSEAGVPGLSSIPILGWFFKSRTRQAQRIERLFLLTPRLVTP